MNHYAASSFWYHYRALPEGVQRVADKNYRLLENNPFHPVFAFQENRR